ncbi:hypothetical protein B0J13DRAFT_605451 [Dactylonectria estremocensis]|uniref:Uncharacterized protein n=1 Tax=Dactylonectria estremocensis TaxID=1079267 RepID=A0A9P9F568_9HYPO|nr:hypothetical protein B0J13DRAFT_605451 [Dactylonectria estremocensis]
MGDVGHGHNVVGSEPKMDTGKESIFPLIASLYTFGTGISNWSWYQSFLHPHLPVCSFAQSSADIPPMHLMPDIPVLPTSATGGRSCKKHVDKEKRKLRDPQKCRNEIEVGLSYTGLGEGPLQLRTREAEVVEMVRVYCSYYRSNSCRYLICLIAGVLRMTERRSTRRHTDTHHLHTDEARTHDAENTRIREQGCCTLEQSGSHWYRTTEVPHGTNRRAPENPHVGSAKFTSESSDTRAWCTVQGATRQINRDRAHVLHVDCP